MFYILPKPVALGIAELDKNVREGSLEWIQVIPEYRRRGLGQAVVNRLLLNFVGKADFVTVSGQVNNDTNPEKLYRKCGFQGNDIWHVILNMKKPYQVQICKHLQTFKCFATKIYSSNLKTLLE
ncbi:MAG TPA: GNAT family N-acetyltransferase [Tissierellia bacterium]|nr:GNAT family N-acetyltransferase [Tissierellia bacterium]